MATQFRSVLKDLVVMFFALAGLGGAVGLYVFLPAVPSVMVATFLGIGIAALVYGFLGGIYTDASFGYGVFKVGGSLAAILIFVGVLTVLAYFFFSAEHKGALGRTAKVGVWYLMITFGASFGFTVMGRIALLAARVEFVFDDWLWLIDPAGKH